MKTYSDLTGRRFGKLIVVNLDKKSGNKYYWKCVCDCGNEKIIRADRLLRGECFHCGCEKKVHYNRENYIGKRFGNLGGDCLLVIILLLYKKVNIIIYQ